MQKVIFRGAWHVERAMWIAHSEHIKKITIIACRIELLDSTMLALFNSLPCEKMALHVLDSDVLLSRNGLRLVPRGA